MPGRRTLRYASLDDVMPDVDRLLAGHETAGKWSLGQICQHLTESFRLTLEGADKIRGPVFTLLRWTVGPMLFRRVLKQGKMPDGLRMPVKDLEPRPGADARAEAEALRATIRLFLAADLPTAHPAFGPITPEQWKAFHAIHCAHHLSFARPTGE